MRDVSLSDPLAVYTRASAGVSNRGINLKFGIESKGGDSDKALMNVLEIKGIGGDAIGWDGDCIRSNSVDSLRYRYFSLNKKNGRDSQVDVTYDLHQESGALAVVGMYGKYTVNDKIWFNYNPFWTVGLVGSDIFMDHGFEGHSSVLTHEATVSYKLSPRSNVRYFANWSQYTNFKDGVHRIEYNYQF